VFFCATAASARAGEDVVKLCLWSVLLEAAKLGPAEPKARQKSGSRPWEARAALLSADDIARPKGYWNQVHQTQCLLTFDCA